MQSFFSLSLFSFGICSHDVPNFVIFLFVLIVLFLIQFPVIDGDFTPPTSPGFIQPTKLIDGATALSSGMIRVYPATITDAQVAQARLHRYDNL